MSGVVSPRRLVGVVAVAVAALLWAQPALSQAAEPESFPDWKPNATFVIIPGTDDADGADQLGRTVGVGWFDGATVENGRVALVQYPAAFGFRILGQLVPLVGDDTYNDSTRIGTENTVALVSTISGPVVLNGFSQSAPIAMNAAYLLHKNGVKDDADIAVLIGGDPRFPNTGVEVVMPSFIDGMLTNGPRNTADTGDIQVTSICVVGDPTCGLANPVLHPFSTVFYLLPGFYVHGAQYQNVDQYTVAKTWTDGNTTYIVYDGGNPWGMMLRAFGVPVPTEVDDVLNIVVPRQMPGERESIAGIEVPTLREVQVSLYDALGLDVPVTDPDALDRLAASKATVTGVDSVDDSSVTKVAAAKPTTKLAELTAPVVEVADETTAPVTEMSDDPTPQTPATPDVPSTTAKPTVPKSAPIPGQNNWSKSKTRPGHDAGSDTTSRRGRWSHSRANSAGSDSDSDSGDTSGSPTGSDSSSKSDSDSSSGDSGPSDSGSNPSSDSTSGTSKSDSSAP